MAVDTAVTLRIRRRSRAGKYPPIWSAISFYVPIHEATQIRPIWRVVIRVHITIRESPDVRILVPTQKTGRRSSEAKSAGSHR